MSRALEATHDGQILSGTEMNHSQYRMFTQIHQRRGREIKQPLAKVPGFCHGSKSMAHSMCQ